MCRDQTKVLLNKHFNAHMDDVVTADRLVFGDYLVPSADPRVYAQVTDMARLVKVHSLLCCLCIVSRCPFCRWAMYCLSSHVCETRTSLGDLLLEMIVCRVEGRRMTCPNASADHFSCIERRACF